MLETHLVIGALQESHLVAYVVVVVPLSWDVILYLKDTTFSPTYKINVPVDVTHAQNRTY